MFRISSTKNLFSTVFLLTIWSGYATASNDSDASASRLDIGSLAPNFEATNALGEIVTLESFEDADVIVLVFTCNHCPVAMAYEERFKDFAASYEDQNVAFLAINCDRNESLDDVIARSNENGLNYSYFYSRDGDVARSYGARVTPHCFVIDQERRLAYKGAFDDKWNGEPEVSYIEEVVTALLDGEESPYTETKAVGCGIQIRR